jgi:type I restriction enzyme S subunit
VQIPNVTVQKKIGQVLFELEEKISANNALSKTLEDIAQTIFRSWFIDFDPVKAKMAGEKPVGMDAATAALFPDSMEESELGLIPKGWKVAGLNEFAKPRKELAKVSSLDSETNYVGLEHLPRNSLFFRTWSSAEKVQSGKSVFNLNDILFGKLRPYFHKVVVSPVAGVCSTDIVVIQSLDSKIDPYTASLVNQDEFITFVTNRSSGTRMPRTSWQEMCEFKIAFPGLNLMQKYNELLEPLFSLAISVCLESNSFENIKEPLLPRLISGELQIPDEMLAS